MSKNLRTIASKIRQSQRRKETKHGVFTFYLNCTYYNLITVRIPNHDAVDDAIYELASITDNSWDDLISNDPKAFWDHCCHLLRKYGDVTVE
ncbi:hypothetical protein [Candidatus Uabimicrobium sp. HlEnr_7]|uniref:hypothetical protein n=1 Tax=Candidatus Uabimicrobium helgolandensis TaxID=3095367 RepID=UPI00355839B6